jgi:hypothetical protein
VDGSTSTAGAYTLSVSALTAFDLYEPNDDILSARKFILGETIQANIMDARDNDYFSFVSPVNGSVSIDIVNRSATLIPALTTFTPDMRSSGFAPDVQKPGADLHHVMPVEANQVFYIQVWGQKETSGAYSLTIK